MSSLTAIPLAISNHPLHRIVRDAKDFALVNGLCLRVKDSSLGDDLLEVPPLTLFPSPFPRHCFTLAKDVQTTMNLLMNSIASDVSFITESLEETVKVDSFTKNLLQVYLDLQRIGISQPLSFGLFRTDYMVDKEHNQLFQVESNAIASGFANLGPKTTRMHSYMMHKYSGLDLNELKDRIPTNESHVNFPKAFINAFQQYGNPSAAILFVVEDRTINLCDQRGTTWRFHFFDRTLKSLEGVGKSCSRLQLSSLIED